MRVDDFLDGIRGVDGVDAAFMGRVDGVEVDRDRAATVGRLEPFHREVVEGMGYGWDHCWRAEQVHGGEVAVVGGGGANTVAGVDGLVTDDAGVMLGIYVADCGVVYLCDPVVGAVGLVHSGKKGTELNIVERAIGLMRDEFGCDPLNMYAALGPCIRPPRYEVDFASEIGEQVRRAGISEENFVDCGVCTGGDLERFYSYRVEEGATGRMLGVIGLVD